MSEERQAGEGGGRLAAACGKCKQAVAGRNIFSFAIRSIRSLPRRNYKKSNIKKKQQKTWNCSWLSEVQARRGAGQGAAAGEVVLHCSSSKNRKGSERVSYQDFDFDFDLQQQRETGFNWRLPVVVRFVLKESLPPSPCPLSPQPILVTTSWKHVALVESFTTCEIRDTSFSIVFCLLCFYFCFFFFWFFYAECSAQAQLAW